MRTRVTLHQQTVAVTGAGRGLGRAYALAAAAAGGRVLVNDLEADAALRTASDVRALGAVAAVHVGSVEDPAVGPELVTTAHEQLGGLDAMILNAGVMDVTPASACTDAELRRVVSVNLLGTMYCGVAALRSMSHQGRGSLVLVVSGARFGMPGLSAYGATKGAVASLVWSWAGESAEHGVRVNGLSPLADTAMFALNPTASTAPRAAAIAPAAVYLASDANVLNGEILRFDGATVALYAGQGSELGERVERPRWSPDEVAAAVARLAR